MGISHQNSKKNARVVSCATLASVHARKASGAAKKDVGTLNIDPDQGDGRCLSARLGNRHDAVCAGVVDRLNNSVRVTVEHQLVLHARAHIEAADLVQVLID
ncbi:hypothetical protein D9M71_653370 [compost metagenome]